VYLSDGPDGIVESGGRVYASRGVFAFDASDGAALWQARCAGSGLCAFDGSTGARLWSLAPVDRIGIGEPAVGGRSLFATCADGLCAFDLGTGDLVWRTPDEIGCAAAASRGCRPVAGGGVVYAPGADGAVRAYDARSGAKLAQIQVGPSPTVILVDGTLYATSSRAVRAYRIP
jgi:outer membrane protein assembly factor BamB